VKVVILTEDLAFGGINRYCLGLARGLGERGDVELRLVALPSQGDPWLLHEAGVAGVPVDVLSVASVQAVRGVIAQTAADVVHSQGYRSNVISRLAQLGPLSRAKSVCTVHGAYHFGTAALRSKGYYVLDYLTMFRSGRVIAVSRETARVVSPWVRKSRLRVVHNGVAVPELPSEAGKAAAKQVLGISPEATVVCYVGRLEAQKGADRLEAVMAGVLDRLPEVVFLVVGGGSLKPSLDGFAAQRGASVVMAGAQADVAPYYAASDLTVLPSRSEGLPMSLIEAFSYGLPGVAFSVGGIPEVMVDGESGFLCEEQRVAALVDRLCRLAADRALRLRMGSVARATAVSRFSLPMMVEATYQVYSSLLQEDGSR
jgi:glycosyltransferase involved in cell wall biosynthesis